MASNTTKLGYCRDCRKNVVHVNRFLTPLGKLWGRLGGRRMATWGWGHWHCPICTLDCFVLPRPRDDVDELRADVSPVVELERVGNHFHDHISLVARQERSQRFSAKFRESVVDRLLSGASNLAQVKCELGVSDSDLLAWIAEKVDRQASQIDQLTRTVARIQTDVPDSPLEPPDWNNSISAGAAVVEGIARGYHRRSQ